MPRAEPTIYRFLFPGCKIVDVLPSTIALYICIHTQTTQRPTSGKVASSKHFANTCTRDGDGDQRLYMHDGDSGTQLESSKKASSLAVKFL